MVKCGGEKVRRMIFGKQFPSCIIIEHLNWPIRTPAHRIITRFRKGDHRTIMVLIHHRRGMLRCSLIARATLLYTVICVFSLEPDLINIYVFRRDVAHSHLFADMNEKCPKRETLKYLFTTLRESPIAV